MSVLVSVFVHEVPINLSCTYAFPAYTNLKAASLKKRGEEKEKEGEDIKRYLMKKKNVRTIMRNGVIVESIKSKRKPLK